MSLVGSGQAVLEQAIRALESHRSVSAKIRQSVDLFGHKPVGSGVYLEQRSEQGVLFRFALRLQLGDQASSLLHVCDGHHVWKYRELGDGEALSRIDLDRVSQALEERGEVGFLGDPEEWPGLGGLGRLLRSLHVTFEFTCVGATRLAGQLPVWKLRGEWKPQKLAGALPEREEAGGEGKPADFRKLPPQLPDYVLLFVGKEDLFPYRIEYRRTGDQPDDSGPAGDRTIVSMDFFGVQLNAPIDPASFVYNPGDLKCADKTNDFLRELGLTP